MIRAMKRPCAKIDNMKLQLSPSRRVCAKCGRPGPEKRHVWPEDEGCIDFKMRFFIRDIRDER